MTDGLKWTVNHVPGSDDKFLDLMSEENVTKANEFHKSFPQYSVTPLQKLSALASSDSSLLSPPIRTRIPLISTSSIGITRHLRLELYRNHQITKETALKYSSNPEMLKRKLM